MIPFPNVIAGILIGVANDTWLARLVIPFVWGIIFCIAISIVRPDKRDAYITLWSDINNSKKNPWGLSHLQAFYFIEFMTASFTSLLFSIISGLIKGLF